MESPEILKLIGASVRWGLTGFSKPFGEFYDEKFERKNFIVSLVFIFIVFVVILPLISLVFFD